MSKLMIFAALVSGIAYYVTSYFQTIPSPIVTIKDGKLQGRIWNSRDGKEYFEYLSIPFAEPPVGDLRFEAPVPLKKPWTGVKDASRYPPFCLQLDALVRGKVYGKEDCLYLNVYTHKNEGKRPVMIFFHGGGFLSGATDMYHPEYYMDEDIVLVTVNYRLAALGFMNLEDGHIRGNMGLKDQLVAMKWVQQNIHHFGGDPKMVTIFGESAGAVSAEYHMLSPLSKGLFQRAILQSGAVTCPWAFRHNPKDTAMQYIKHTECANEKGDKLVQCLKRIDAVGLVTPALSMMDPINPIQLFVPTIETVKREDTFLSENPRQLLKAGKIISNVPVIMGFTSGEGALRTAKLEAVPESIPKLDKNWEEYAARSLFLDEGEVPPETARKIRNTYFGGNSFTDDLHQFKLNFSQMVSHGGAFEPIQRAALAHSKEGAPTYMYYYEYEPFILPSLYSLIRGVRNDDWLFADIKVAYAVVVDLVKKWLRVEGPHEFGSCHADDLMIAWNMEGWSKLLAGPDAHFSKAFIKVMVDFAKNKESLEFDGVTWPRFKPGTPTSPPQYMFIGREPKVIPEPFTERLRFWESLKLRI